MGISQRQEERSTLEKDRALTMGLPRPSIMPGIPETKEQALSDFMLHAGISAGVAIGVYAYTGLYAGPGHMGILYRAFFSPVSVGARGASTVAMADTAYAASVYAEPFIAATRFAVRWSLPTFAVYAFYTAATADTSDSPVRSRSPGMRWAVA